MANCFICQTELGPPVRACHTVYVRKLFYWAVRPTDDTTSFRSRWRPASSPRSRPAPVLTSPDGALPGLDPVAGCNAPAGLPPYDYAPRVAAGPIPTDIR